MRKGLTELWDFFNGLPIVESFPPNVIFPLKLPGLEIGADLLNRKRALLLSTHHDVPNRCESWVICSGFFPTTVTRYGSSVYQDGRIALTAANLESFARDLFIRDGVFCAATTADDFHVLISRSLSTMTYQPTTVSYLSI